MDKVKVFLAVLKKHHFWVLAGLVLILGLTIYVAAAADLQGRYQTRSKKLNDAVQAARQITQVTEHPNEKKIKNWDLARDLQKEKVLASWKALYDKQQKENPWPPKLGKDFLDVIKALKPDEEIPVQQCGIYQHFIESELEPLFAIVDYRHPELIELKEGERPGAATGAPGTMGGMGGMAGMGAPGMEGLGGAAGQTYKTVGTVDWNPQDQQRIRGEFYFASRPSSARVRLAQEDYWVYQALLNIIKKTNGNASTHSAVAVKQINTVQIGRAAASAIGMGRSSAFGGGGGGMGMGAPGEGAMPGAMPGMAPPGGGAMQGAGAEPGMGAGMAPPGGGAMQSAGAGPGMGMPAAGGMGMEGGMTGMGGGTSSAPMSPDDYLLNFRYVDSSFNPLPVGTDPPFWEFKMMPVYLHLKIDQRKIPELLVECANSTMPVEIKKVRINPGSGGSALGGMEGGAGGMGAPGMEGMGGRGMEGMGGPGAGMGGPGAGMGGPGAGMGGPGMGMGGPGAGMGGPGMGMGGPGMGMGGPGMGMGGPGMGMGGPGMGMGAPGMGMGPHTGAPGMGAPGMGMGAPGMEPGMTGPGMGGMGTSNEGDNPYEVVIELCGIIYIYNPPNPEKLATGTGSEKTGENTTDAATGPAAVQPGQPGPTATQPTALGAQPAAAPTTPTPATGVPATGVPATGVPPTGVPPGAGPMPGAPPAAAPAAAAAPPAAPPAAPAAATPTQP